MAFCCLMSFITGCIKNDIPYPRIPQNILAIAARGESAPAEIDSINYKVHIALEEDANIAEVRFTEFVISPEAHSDVNLLEGTYDLSQPLFVTLSLYQDYVWEITATQTIERYFEVEGEVGASVVDAVAKRVVVTMPEGTDLSRLTLLRAKLGPAGITTMTPSLDPGPLDLSYPLQVTVTANGQEEIWTIYAELTETIVSTTQVDAWSMVVWAYGSGPAEVVNGFEYRKTSESEWHEVPQEDVVQTQGTFSACIRHLEPLTEYSVRAVSGADKGNEVIVTTEAIADIPDGSFDQWSKTDAGMWQPWNVDGERFWDTGNRGSFTVKVNITTPTDHTATGSGQAAKLESKFVSVFGIGKLASGAIFTGEYLRTAGMDGVLGFGRPWKLRPTKLRGFMQYETSEITRASADFADMKGQPDSCQIYVALTDWTAPYEIRTKASERQLFDPNASYVIAYGQLTFGGTQNGYVPFEIELNYRSTSKVPTYLQITSTSSKYGDYFTGGESSVLYVDEYSFDWDY